MDEREDFYLFLLNKGLGEQTSDKYARLVSAIEGDPLKHYTQTQAGGKASVGTLTPLRAAIQWWLRYGDVPEEDVSLYLPPMKGHKGLQRSGLEADQLKVFQTRLIAVPEPSRTILQLLPETGLRISEIVSLKGSNIQRAGKHTVLRFSGKGQKIRTVPLNKNAMGIWREYQQSGHAPTIKPNGYIFPGKKPNTHITARAITHHTGRMAALEPSLGGLSPHVLRHTFATRAIQKGASVAHVMQLLGHSNIATTQRYLHPTLSDLASIVDAF